jgi:uncharacterized protein with HEPN domain
MKMSDFELLQYINNYCNSIDDAINRFGNSFDKFFHNKHYQHSIFFAILQIGELATRFSQKFLTKTNEIIPWEQYYRMSDRFSHGYVTMDLKIIWSTVIEDIPKLQAFCNEKIAEMRPQENQTPVVEKETSSD